jgi:hypothetical protein
MIVGGFHYSNDYFGILVREFLKYFVFVDLILWLVGDF